MVLNNDSEVLTSEEMIVFVREFLAGTKVRKVRNGIRQHKTFGKVLEKFFELIKKEFKSITQVRILFVKETELKFFIDTLPLPEEDRLPLLIVDNLEDKGIVCENSREKIMGGDFGEFFTDLKNINSAALTPVVIEEETIAALVFGSEDKQTFASSDQAGWFEDLGNVLAAKLESLLQDAQITGFLGELRSLAEQVMVLTKERAALNSELAFLREAVITDLLTGVLNRRGLEEVLKKILSRTKRHGGKNSIILIDLDSFKEINDTLGHNAGDAVLVDFAHRAEETLREEDSIGRMGGDEFLVILIEGGEEEAGSYLGRLRSNLKNKPCVFRGKSIPISFSAGITEIRPDDSTLDELKERADRKMYEEKSAKKK